MRAALPSALLAAFGTGCVAGSTHPSVIETLQVVGMVAEPPTVGPGETAALDVGVADPDGLGAELLLWTCTLVDGACAEALLGSLDSWTRTTQVTQPIESFRIEVPESAGGLLDGGAIEVPLYALTCQPGLCPLIDDVYDANQVGESPNSIARKLADPASWMAELPMDGVSLATRRLTITNAPASSRNGNPDVAPRFTGSEETTITMAPGEELRMSFYSDDPDDDSVRVYAYTTLGSFESAREKVKDHIVHHYLLAPDSTGTGDVFVIFEDQEGGSAMFHWELQVR